MIILFETVGQKHPIEWDNKTGQVRKKFGGGAGSWFGNYTEEELIRYGWRRCKPRQLENK